MAIVLGEGESQTVRRLDLATGKVEAVTARSLGALAMSVLLDGSVVVQNGIHPSAADPVVGNDSVAAIGAPLRRNGPVIGAIIVGSSTSEFEPHDVQLLEIAASRLVAAVELRRLFDGEHRARIAAEHARSQLSLLARAGDQLAPVLLDGEGAIGGVGHLLVPAFADVSLILLHDPSGPPRPRLPQRRRVARRHRHAAVQRPALAALARRPRRRSRADPRVGLHRGEHRATAAQRSRRSARSRSSSRRSWSTRTWPV